VRRIPDLNPSGQDGSFDVWQFHAFFTTSRLDTVAADKTHRGHVIIEQLHADMENSALAHLPFRLHLPLAWPRQQVWSQLIHRASGHPAQSPPDHPA
jgi:hypothetical protein